MTTTSATMIKLTSSINNKNNNGNITVVINDTPQQLSSSSSSSSLPTTTIIANNNDNSLQSSSSIMIIGNNNVLNNSSKLLKRLEQTNWLCSINTILNGTPTTLLLKYLFDDQQQSYAILVSDFAATYFECITGGCGGENNTQLEQNYNKYNKLRLLKDNLSINNNDNDNVYDENQKIKNVIYKSLKTLILNMPETIKNVEKVQVDCHTTRITLKCLKQITSKFTFKWTFHLISTDESIFLKHLSMPLFRGLIHYYNLSNSQQHQQQQQPQQLNQDQPKQELMETNHDNGEEMIDEKSNLSTRFEAQSNQNNTNSSSAKITLQSDWPFNCIDSNLLKDIFRYD